MKRHATENNEPIGDQRQSHTANFAKVLNGRKQPIRGLWVRNGRFYARMSVENPLTGVKKTRRIPLVNKEGTAVETVPAAVEELRRLQTQRSDNMLPTLERTPKFSTYAKKYLEFISSGQGKKPGTVKKETTILGRWTDHLGELRLDQIKRVHVNRFIESRLKEVDEDDKPIVNPRTINLDVIGFRVVMKRAFSDGLIQRLPTEGLKPLKTTMVKRPFFNTADLDKICQAAFLTKKNEDGDIVPLTKNAQEFVDYVRLMAYCGARRNEALALRWDDVDFSTKQLTVGADGDTKNRTSRVVDFNPKLKAHLLDMKRRRPQDCKWLFPSPQRGTKDVPLKTLRESLELVRTKASLAEFRFHDCRHHFISMAVMSGVDFMTIASWVGHRDGGILIGKVYGHLANEHRKLMADRMAFEPVVLPAVNQ
jgi:integrase